MIGFNLEMHVIPSQLVFLLSVCVCVCVCVCVYLLTVVVVATATDITKPD